VAEILTFKKTSPPTTSRQAFIESLLALGAGGSDMTLDVVITKARETAWREAVQIADNCSHYGWCSVEGEHFPLVDTLDEGAREDAAAAAALVVACDLILAKWTSLRPSS
jgi:hypothetical protein